MSEGGNKPGDLLVVTKAYSRRMDDEITIQPGQTVRVVTNDAEFNDGWYIGKNLDTGFEGLFPRLFTRPKTPEHERVVSVKNTMQDIDNALAALRNSSIDMLRDDNHSVVSAVPSISDAMSQESEPFTPALEIASEAFHPIPTAGVAAPPEENVPMWTPQQVSAYFLSKGFDPEVANKFQDRGVTGARLLDLQLSDLKQIQIDSFGARFEVFKLIDSLRLFPVRPATPHAMSAGAPRSTGQFESPGKAPQPPSYPSPVQPRMSPMVNKFAGNENNGNGTFPSLASSPSPSPALRHPSEDYRYPSNGQGANRNSASFNFPSNGKESPVLAPVNLQLRSTSTASSSGNNSHDMGSFTAHTNKSNGTTIATSIGDTNANVNAMLRQKKPQHKKTASSSSFVDLFNRISMLSVTDETFNEEDTLTHGDTTANDTTTHMSRPASAIYSTSHSRSASAARPVSMIYSTSHSRTTSAANQYSINHARTPSTSNMASVSHSRSPSKSGMYGHSRTPSGVNAYSNSHTRTPSGVNHLNTHARTPSGVNYSNTHARTPSGVGASHHSHSAHPRTPSTTNMGSHSRSASGVKSHVRQISLGNSEVKKSRRSSVLSFLSPSKKNKDNALEKSQAYNGDKNDFDNTPSGKKHDSSYSRKSSAALTSVRHQSLGNEAVMQTSTTNTSGSSGNSNQKAATKSKSKFPLQKSAKKKQTSAFQEGIRTISVEKATLSSDCSGWMSKKGTGSMGVWKTRYFTLHGSRLSYFSNTQDSKERGLIDITGHKVVPIQDDDTLISLYAASIGRGKYFFKLVPPQPGFKKGLTFTQPRVHYFAVESMDEMRSWVAAFIKANIELDDTTPIIASYNMPTVSLSKAQTMLKEAKEEMTRRDQDKSMAEVDEDEMMWEEQKKKNDMLAAGFI